MCAAVKVPIINRSGLPLPRYESSGAVGLDLRACVETEVILLPTTRKLIPTGIYIALPPGYEAQLRPRSSLALQHGITLLNTPGTIDPDYRGELKLLLINLGEAPFTIKRGDRIAQLVLTTYTRVAWEVVEQLTPTARGEGGYGSTGKT